MDRPSTQPEDDTITIFKMPRLKHVAIAHALATATLATAGPGLAQTTRDMPTPCSDSTFRMVHVHQFMANVKSALAGKLDITVHSNASLVKLPEMRCAVANGQVQLGELLIAVLSNQDPMFGFDSIPGLANSYADARKMYGAALAQLEAGLEKACLVMLSLVAWPPQAINTNKPINALADLKGSKFRSFNPVTARFAELIGASATTIQVPAFAQAFRPGAPDAMIASGATGVDSQAWDYLTHDYGVQAFLPQRVVIANKAIFTALSADQQAALRAAAARADGGVWKMSEELNETYTKTLADKGIKVLPPTDVMKAELKKIGETMAADWAAKAGADGAAVLAASRK